MYALVKDGKIVGLTQSRNVEGFLTFEVPDDVKPECLVYRKGKVEVLPESECAELVKQKKIRETEKRVRLFVEQFIQRKREECGIDLTSDDALYIETTLLAFARTYGMDLSLDDIRKLVAKYVVGQLNTSEFNDMLSGHNVSDEDKQVIMGLLEDAGKYARFVRWREKVRSKARAFLGKEEVNWNALQKVLEEAGSLC